MLIKWIVFQTVIQVFGAMLTFDTPDNDTWSFANASAVPHSDIDFQAIEAEALNVSSIIGNKDIAAQIVCPPNIHDVVYQYLVQTLNGQQNFRTVELPPFLQVRFSNGPGNAVVRQYIKTTFQGLAWTVEEDVSSQTTPLGLLQFTNVIATLNPQNAKRLVLACHYESKFAPTGYLGAIEAAVPCALLVDLAKRLNELFRFVDSAPVSIQMIFFDGKEAFGQISPTDSLYGSRNLASKWENTVDPLDVTKNKLGNIDYFILLNTLGHATTNFEYYYLNTQDLHFQLYTIEVCLALRGLLARPLPLSSQLFRTARRSIFLYDDHVPFNTRNVRTLHLATTYPFPPQWHTLEDNANILDYNVIEDLNRILRVFIANYYIVENISV